MVGTFKSPRHIHGIRDAKIQLYDYWIWGSDSRAGLDAVTIDLDKFIEEFIRVILKQP